MISFMMLSAGAAYAQQSVVDAINEYGNFDKWSRREIKESGVIGGNTKYLYEFYGDYGTTFTGKTPFKAPEGYLWRTNNVLAVVAGVCKTNNTVFPEKRGRGYCARIETHIEEVNAVGIINMSVTCQGAMMIGVLPEPITGTKDPMSRVLYGVPFNGRPKALRMDIKADVGHETIRGTGFSKLKNMGYPDYAEMTVILQKRWEDKAFIYWYDEPTQNTYTNVIAGMKLLKETMPGVKRLLTEQPEKELLGNVDIWCPMPHYLHTEHESTCRKVGEEFWWYLCTEPKALDGYAMREKKTVSVCGNVLRVEHEVENAGEKAFEYSEYNHNFLTLDLKGARNSYNLTMEAGNAGYPYKWRLAYHPSRLTIHARDYFEPHHHNIWSPGWVISPEVFFVKPLQPGEKAVYVREWEFGC